MSKGDVRGNNSSGKAYPIQVRTRGSYLLLTAAIVLGIHLLIILVVRGEGWDDGAITLSFSRTFAETGNIALTPNSVEVEGFSSVAWFLLASLIWVGGVSTFYGLIVGAQVLSALCAMAAAVVFALLLARELKPVWASIVAVTLFGSAPFLNETMNGMEMSLLALLLLLIVLLYLRSAPSLLLGLLGALCVAVRIESAAYVLALAGTLVIVYGSRRQGLALSVGVALCLVLGVTARIYLLGSVLPNTLYAKSWAPYSGGGATDHLKAALEPLAAVGAVLLAAVVLVWRCSKGQNLKLTVRRVLGEPQVVSAFGICLAIWVVNIVIGRNWGYLSRMQLAALPFMLILAVGVLRQMNFEWSSKRVGVFAAVLWLGALAALQWENVAWAVSGPTSAPAVRGSPVNYAETGGAAESVRVALGRDNVSILTPDIGGASLCCPDVAIHDLALLANPVLARAGYADFERYLSSLRPDLIETHGLWSTESGIYDTSFFRANYQPLVVDRTWIWVRKDLRILLPLETFQGDAATLRYRGNSVDESYVAGAVRGPVMKLGVP